MLLPRVTAEGELMRKPQPVAEWGKAARNRGITALRLPTAEIGLEGSRAEVRKFAKRFGAEFAAR